MRSAATRRSRTRPHRPTGGRSGRHARGLAAAAAIALGACQDGGSGGAAPKEGPGPDGSYLHVSAPSLYFGTRELGTRSTQEIELVNRGADLYSIGSVRVAGKHAEQFTADLLDPVRLGPTEAVRLGVTFAPLDEGVREAELDIAFDTDRQVDDATNRNEWSYYRARELEGEGDYAGAAQVYSDYVANDPVTSNERRAAIRLPLVREADRYGEGRDAELYLRALDARERGAFDEAATELDVLLMLHPRSALADDARYLKGYIALVDRGEHAAALVELQRLRVDYPDSTYYDTALYGEALAQEGLGNDALARSIYLDLRERHTGVDALGLRLPKDDLVSRLWFERADAALAALETG